MNFVKNDLSAEFDTIEIEIFSDLHIGSKKCDMKMIKERVERVKNNDNVFAIVLGDVIDNATKTSVGDTYEQSMSPMNQIKNAVMIFEPIKTKILGVVSGNHCDRSYKTDGVDLLHFMCVELGISDKYDSVANLLFIKFGNATGKHTGRKIPYSLYMTHGNGASGTVGGKANALEKRGRIIDADIIVQGHTHQQVTFRESSYKVNFQNYNANLVEQVFVNASATLDYEGYAEKFGMKPNSKVSPVIILDGHTKQVIIRV